MEYALVVVWLAAYVALAALAAPATAALLTRFPDRGAGLALPVALATLALVAFWVGRVAFGYPALVAGMLVLAGLSAFAVSRGATVDRESFVEVMAVFAVAFLFLITVRALDPAVHPGGGEKFLDFGLLNSLLRTTRLPPEDFWFAGEPVQYYYGGHMIAALLAKLTGTPPRLAYNPALAGVYATLVTATYSLAGGLASHRGYPRRSAGLFAAFLVGVASNVSTPLRALAWAVPGADTVAEALGLPATGLARGPASFSYWTASRVIEGTITEFPFFAFVNGDLHAHMMSTPFLLLVTATLFAYWRTPAVDLRRRRVLVFGVLPALAGLLAVVNTWSFPTVAGLTWLGLLFAPSDPVDLVPVVGGTPTPTPTDERDATTTATPTTELRRYVGALLAAVVVGGLGALVVAPFFTDAASGRSVAFNEAHSGLFELLAVHAVFLAVTVRYLTGRVAVEGRALVRRLALVVMLALTAWLFLPAAVAVFAPLLGTAWLFLRTDRDVSFETALVVGVAGLVILVEFVHVTRAGRYNTVFKTYMQVWVLWATATGVMLSSYTDPVAAVSTVVARLRRAVDRRRQARRQGPATDGGRTGTLRPGVAGSLALVIVVSTALYGGLAMAEHVETHGGEGTTLDATAFVEENHRYEAGAIAFVRGLEGQPNVLSAPTRCMYRWSDDRAIQEWLDRGEERLSPNGACDRANFLVGSNAAASLTGVPTVAGWYHEVGYRGAEPFDARVRDVRTMYTGEPAKQASLLRTYDVEYVYVGPAERQRYGATPFDGVTGVDPVYRTGAGGQVTVYEVNADYLGVANAEENENTSVTVEDRLRR